MSNSIGSKESAGGMPWPEDSGLLQLAEQAQILTLWLLEMLASLRLTQSHAFALKMTLRLKQPSLCFKWFNLSWKQVNSASFKLGADLCFNFRAFVPFNTSHCFQLHSADSPGVWQLCLPWIPGKMWEQHLWVPADIQVWSRLKSPSPVDTNSPSLGAHSQQFGDLSTQGAPSPPRFWLFFLKDAEYPQS